MTKSHLAAVAALALFSACGGTGPRDPQWSFFSGREPEPLADEDGTELTADAAVLGTSCDSGQGVSTFGGTVTTTGSVDSVQIVASIDDGAVQVVGEIPPEAFSGGEGSVKTAEYAVTLATREGAHTVRLCFIQSGSQGSEPKTTCAETLTVEVVCEVGPCGTGRPFGNLVSNGNLCQGKGPPKIPVHVTGDLGDAPALSIAGPGGYTHEAVLRHAGDSCNYHYVWDTAGNGGAGHYAFVVTGNGQTVEWGAELHCR